MNAHFRNRSSAPSAVETLEFQPVGIEWVVRRTTGERYAFNSLSRLRIALYNQTITVEDELSFNRDLWRNISDIPDLRSYFWMVWQRAQRGGLPSRTKTLVGAPSLAPDDEFDDDLPTRIVAAPPLLPAMQAALSGFTNTTSRPSAAPVIGPSIDEFDEDQPTRLIGVPSLGPGPRRLVPGPTDSLVPGVYEVLLEDAEDSLLSPRESRPAAHVPMSLGIKGIIGVAVAATLGGSVAMVSVIALLVLGIL